jgi:hypothetical protein
MGTEGYVWPRGFLGGYVSDDSRRLGEWIMAVCNEMNRWAMRARG